MAVPGVSAVGSAVGKGASAAGSAASKTAVKRASSTAGNGLTASSGRASSAAARTAEKAQGAPKHKTDSLKGSGAEYQDPAKRKELLDRAKEHDKSKGGGEEPFDKMSAKQVDMQNAVLDNAPK